MTFNESPNLPLAHIGAGYSEADQRKIHAVFSDLLPHLSGDFCICGGIATQCALSRDRGRPIIHRKLNDIDLIADKSTILLPTVTRSLQILHYHPQDNVDGFYIQLLHRLTNVTVDIFGAARFIPQLSAAAFEDQLLPIRSPANQLAVLCSAVHRRITKDLPLILKQLHDIRSLSQVIPHEEIVRAWRFLELDPFPETILLDAEAYLGRHPDRIYKPHQDTTMSCTQCSAFPQ